MFSLIKLFVFFPFYLAYYFIIFFYKIFNIILEAPLITDLSTIDSMNGLQFEDYISKLLEYENFFNIKNTKASGDFGADIIAEKNGDRYAIQCKRYSHKVNSKPIGEVLRGMKKYNCNKGIVITNNFFTKQAVEEGKICNIELWDRLTLKSIIRKHSFQTSSVDNINLTNNNNIVIKKNITLEKLDYDDYKNIATKIQKSYYELGFNVKVVDINTTNKFKTEYKCIHELGVYSSISSKETGEQFLNLLNIENVSIREINKKYFIINIPKSIT